MIGAALCLSKPGLTSHIGILGHYEQGGIVGPRDTRFRPQCGMYHYGQWHCDKKGPHLSGNLHLAVFAPGAVNQYALVYGGVRDSQREGKEALHLGCLHPLWSWIWVQLLPYYVRGIDACISNIPAPKQDT